MNVHRKEACKKLLENVMRFFFFDQPSEKKHHIILKVNGIDRFFYKAAVL